MHFLNYISAGVGEWQHPDKLKKNQKPVYVPGTVLVSLIYNDFKEITTILCSSSTAIIFYKRRNWSWMGHEEVPQQSKNTKLWDTQGPPFPGEFSNEQVSAVSGKGGGEVARTLWSKLLETWFLRIPASLANFLSAVLWVPCWVCGSLELTSSTPSTLRIDHLAGLCQGH